MQDAERKSMKLGNKLNLRSSKIAYVEKFFDSQIAYC